MPFRSKSQLRTCYGKHDSRWNCDEWLSKTDSVCCLPEKKGLKVKCRPKKKNEIVKGPIKQGPKGGKYFEITEKNKNGTLCVVKIYI